AAVKLGRSDDDPVGAAEVAEKALDRISLRRLLVAPEKGKVVRGKVQELGPRANPLGPQQGAANSHLRCAARAQAAGQPDDVCNYSCTRFLADIHRRIAPSLACTAGATRVPMSSIACVIFSCANDAAFIWNVTREIPPSASLCRRIFSAISSGSPIIRAPSGPICASKSRR